MNDERTIQNQADAPSMSAADETRADADHVTAVPPQNPLPQQGRPYRPVGEQSDDEDLWIATGEHVDEYADDDDGLALQTSPHTGSEHPAVGSETDDVGGSDSQSAGSETGERLGIRRFMRYLRQDGGAFVPWRLREITNSGDQAIVLGQVLYWFDFDSEGKPRARVHRRGKRWFYKSHAEFSLETGIPPRQIRTCLQALKERGFIEIDHFMANGQRTTHISLNLAAVHQAMSKKQAEKRAPEADQTSSVSG
jgi:hypothetical protein